jgi:hypothetical protein
MDQGLHDQPHAHAKAGVSDYRAFAREVLAAIPDRPISFEVFSDDFDEMARQAHEIASWGANVNVKIPVTNTRGEPSYQLIRDLAAARIMLNVTRGIHARPGPRRGGAPRSRDARYVSLLPAASPTPGAIRCRTWRPR